MAEKLGTWKQRLDAAKLKRQEYETDNDWAQVENMYKGRHWENVTTSYDQLTFNFIEVICETIRDSVYFQNPKFHFSTAQEEFKNAAKDFTTVFPYMLRRMKYKFMTKLALMDALKWGFGYKYNAFAEVGDPANDIIREDEIYSLWIPHDSVYWDPDAHGSWDANYCFYEVDVPRKQIERNPSYKLPKDFDKFPDSYVQDHGEDFKTRDKDDLRRIKIVHVFDRGEGEHRIFTDEWKNWIYRGDWPLGDCTLFPINMLRLKDNGLYPNGVIKGLITVNQEINKMESMKLNHAKRFNRKYKATGGWDKKELRDLTSGVDGTVVHCDDVAADVTGITDMQMDPAVYASLESMYFIMKMLSRVGEYRFGTGTRGDTTATEANYIESGTSLGVNYDRDVVGDFCMQDAEILGQLISMHYEESKMYQIANDMSKNWRGMDLQGADLNVMVNVEAAGPPDAPLERQEAVALMQLMANDPWTNPVKIRQKLLDTFMTVRDPEEFLNSPQTIQLITQFLAGGGEKMIDQYINKDREQNLIQAAGKFSALPEPV